MPGGPTMIFKGLGELCREVKGLESLGVSIGGRRACAGGMLVNRQPDSADVSVYGTSS